MIASTYTYLAVREGDPKYDNVFLARNGTSMDQRTVRYRMKKYYKEAGIRKKASVHTLRHTFATHQIHNGLKLRTVPKTQAMIWRWKRLAVVNSAASKVIRRDMAVLPS